MFVVRDIYFYQREGRNSPSKNGVLGGNFDSWSGHLPGLWARSLLGAHRRGNQSTFLTWMFFSPSPSHYKQTKKGVFDLTGFITFLKNSWR